MTQIIPTEAIHDAVVAALAQTTGYASALFAPDIDLLDELGLSARELAAAVQLAAETLDPRRTWRDLPTSATSVATVARALAKLIHPDEGRGMHPEITLDRVLAFVDERAAKQDRPTLELLLAETTNALVRVEHAARAAASAGAPDAQVAPPVMAHQTADSARPRGVDAQAVLAFITRAMAAKTGYDLDLLQPDLDLEVELGIDTITQVEVIALARAEYGLDRDPKFRVRDYKTLRDVAQYLARRTRAPEAHATTHAAVAAPEPGPHEPEVAAEGLMHIMAMLVDALVERTGYPPDMLEPDLDLEADLGIDTVKQVEAFALARQAAQVDKDERFRLRDYNTLRKMATYIAGRAAPRRDAVPAARSPEPAQVTAPVAAPVAAPIAPATATEGPRPAILAQLVAALVERTGYPADMLEPDLDLEAELGIDTVKQVEAFAAARVAFGVDKDQGFRLRDHNTLNKMADYLAARTRGAPPPPAEVRATTASPPLAEPPQPSPVALSEIQAFLVAVLQEKTGYNVEILQPELDLEVELGIDTITQVEAVAAARVKFGIARDEAFRIRKYNTIGKLAGYLAERVASIPPAPPTADAPVPVVELGVDDIRRFVAQCVANGDVASLRRLEAHLRDRLSATPRIQLTAPEHMAGKRYEVRPAAEPTEISSERVGQLRGKTLGLTADTHGAHPSLTSRLQAAGARVVLLDPAVLHDPGAAEQLRSLDGVILLHTTAQAPPLANHNADAWTAAVNAVTLATYHAARSVYDRIDELPGGGWFLVATAGGGLFGHANADGRVPLGAAAGGFLKCVQHERPNARVIALDLDPADRAHWSEQIWSELVGTGRDVEVGYCAGKRHVLRDIEVPLRPTLTAGTLEPGAVVVVSGGGRGVVYHCAALLARVTAARVIITGRTLPPNGDEPWLKLGDADLKAYRMSFIMSHMKAHPGTTPVQAMSVFDATIARARELHRNLEDCRAQGLSIEYQVCDMTDAAAVRTLLAGVRRKYGRIDGIVHGATIEESKSLPMKSVDVVLRTLASKAHLWQTLVQETWDDPLKFCINFGSGSGRYGNKGQTDYSAANCLVAKSGMVYAGLRPGVRSVTIDWPVWVGAGIVENNADYLERLKSAGVCVINVAEGAYWFVGELLYGGGAGEVVIADEQTFANLGSRKHAAPAAGAAPTVGGGLRATDTFAAGVRYAL